MSRDARYDILFEPLQIGPKTLPNRFWQVPQCTGSTAETPLQNALHRSVKAEGGWGAVFTELISIHPEADALPLRQPTLWDDDDVRQLSLLAAAIHEHDALAGIELGYSGFTRGFGERLVARNPSQLGNEVFEGLIGYGVEATEEEIRDLAADWATAARRARDAGYDIICIHGSQDLGPARFLSPFHNKREDQYGGSLENRTRHWIEVVQAVRDAVGDDCAIVPRVSLDDLRGDGGVPLGDALQVLRWLDPLVDAFDLNISSWDWGEDIAASRFYPENHEALWHLEARNAVTKPIIGVGRLTSPDTMVAAIKNGQLDVIGAARPSIADPFLPRKIDEGRVDEIRECIGCNACIARWEAHSRVVCTQNATMMEEFRRGWHPEIFTKAKNHENDVIVIGSGPAGLECAMVLAKREMRNVHLIDGASTMGGVLRWLPELPRLGDWRRLLDYRQIQLDKLSNIEVITRTPMTPEDALDYGAGYVVVATGAHFAADGTNHVTHAPIPGVDASLPHILTPEQIMLEGKEVPGRTVAVLDFDGYAAGLGLTELLSQKGHAVTYITPFVRPAAYTLYTGELPNVARLMRELDVELLVETYVSVMHNGQLTLHGLFEDGFRRFPDASDSVREPGGAGIVREFDAVVLATGRRSDTELYRGLMARKGDWADAGVQGVFRAGDCVSPRQLSEAIFDGHRLGREFDSSDPATPLRTRRELSHWGAMHDADGDPRKLLTLIQQDRR
ncbi:FAD-dependent oxidoreductase [Nocardioides eburneiflavus]|nr:FAD-dependent oxidoreductase [Nocardioides eburneiflavus]